MTTEPKPTSLYHAAPPTAYLSPLADMELDDLLGSMLAGAHRLPTTDILRTAVSLIDQNLGWRHVYYLLADTIEHLSRGKKTIRRAHEDLLELVSGHAEWTIVICALKDAPSRFVPYTHEYLTPDAIYIGSRDSLEFRLQPKPAND